MRPGFLSPLLILCPLLLGGCGTERSMDDSMECVPEGDVDWGCRDGTDNDGDGYVDCDDVHDCGNHPDCGGTCGPGSTERPTGTGQDTDADGPDTAVDLSPLSVTVFPAQPTPQNDLECRVESIEDQRPATDPDEAPPVPTYTFHWFVTPEGGETRVYEAVEGPKLSSEHTGEGDTWTCQATRYLDGVQDGSSVAAEPVNILVNHPPTSPGVTISVQETGDLLCLIETPSEDDLGAAIRYSYAWLVQDDHTTAERAEAGPIVAADQTTAVAGQTWICLVTPSDGVTSGEPGQSQHEIPQGECVFSSYGARGYQFCSIPRSRDEAQASCEQFGMDLVSVMSETENIWVSDTAQLKFENYGAFFQRYWVGLELGERSETWYRSGGLEASYLEPALSGQTECGVTSTLFGQDSGTWQENSCEELHGYVCEERSYVFDSGDVALDGRSPSSPSSLLDHGWSPLYNGGNSSLSYTAECSRGEQGLGLKTYSSGGLDTGVSVGLDRFETDVAAEVWAKPQGNIPMGALTVSGQEASGNTLDVSLRTLEDASFECVVGSTSVGLSGFSYVSGGEWYRFAVQVGSDGTARCQVSLESGAMQEASLSVSLGASFNTVEIHSLVASTANDTLTYWADFKLGW
ncbi:MAG: C-type lectin domain-containing protein, partial [Myxococcota bacterium]|nr:C-type lectin domain-containing protein [Myxococcota bacterium]